ncbi:hypothetical protein AMAG_12605 [Allomyces macrogynus ATCC 38327]|uniref:Uncharacterized protein n=1 Tax=Allomyces macrogynus (strain ATCC 38327) TaxID=578462 RepID=A0A0L0SZV5_ALLM3|nr:hypothetical protein AMAG_12605 [Allomyces macrogynus ATCC 38327]|eukprot:KNE67889.1 hypothetical protein AMAG_12605 [Allomyces macrogynus ATCC 38327]
MDSASAQCAREGRVGACPERGICPTRGPPPAVRPRPHGARRPPTPAPPAPAPGANASSLRAEFAARHPAYLAAWRAVHAARDKIAVFANLQAKLTNTRAGSNAEAAVLREIEAAAEKWDAVGLRETVAKWQEMHAEMERLRVQIVQSEAREEVAVAEAAAASAVRSRG